ncbi:hypothetical protein DL766_008929 [Monosporascus sp. MC13-8B]|uniref:Uncharacterized protein n=1 Tax=Monosporascus cannonballus TaxID=155416 RepID=A0ABY0H3L2_9PEZI|nr:hypothetical protein DL763_010566 [Monosporascus cannonballus]RYO83984.1 hypothetical protein DL762_005886 [Monosporascus cannonballus]RYP17334.1 hypothetical protein DL766_008929 [Monosporascus sp. MC13-8B]
MIPLRSKRDEPVKNMTTPSTPQQLQGRYAIDNDAGAGESDGSCSEDAADEHSASNKRRVETEDLLTLQSPIHASPILHGQYRCDRNSVLRECLDRELDGFLIDAHASLVSQVRELGPRGLTRRSPAFSTPTVVRSQTCVHVQTEWALANLGKAIPSSAAQEGAAETPVVHGDCDIRPSRGEEIRFLRALYRCESYYPLFGRNRDERRGGLRQHRLNESFFCLFGAWEAGAVGWIEFFVRQRHEEIFNDVKDYMDGTFSRGLKMAAGLLATDDYEKLASEMQRCLTHDQCLDGPTRKALESVAQNDRREMSPNFPDARDEAEQRRDPLEFVGDAVSPDGPPLAWAPLWGAKYTNIYGEYVPESLRRLGYVMWDERRWTDIGAKGLVASQWETALELVEEIEDGYNWGPVGR